MQQLAKTWPKSAFREAKIAWHLRQVREVPSTGSGLISTVMIGEKESLGAASLIDWSWASSTSLSNWSWASRTLLAGIRCLESRIGSNLKENGSLL